MRLPVLLALLSLSFPASAWAQDTAPPRRAVEEEPTTEEAQRAQLTAESQASAAPLTATPSETEDETDEDDEGVVSDDEDGDGRDDLSRAVFPPPPPPAPDPDDPELDEGFAPPPPPEPPWRLRLGVGASIATAGGPILSLRLIQEVEWMPPEVAPILFALTGGEVLGEYVMGLGGARVGLYGMFCQDRIVTCTGTVALRAGVIGGTAGIGLDLGGDGDARFRFDGVELTIRVGFFVIQSVTFIDAVGMVGAAF